MAPSFDIAAFQKHLETQWLGRNIIYKETLDSTNTFVKKVSAEEITPGMLCITDNQTRGRGQYERKWKSKKGENLTFSLVFQPQTSERMHVLTLACALALLESINSMFEERKETCIKWPNDVKVNGKKMAGVLSETVFNGNRLDRLIIGMGININQTEFPHILTETATSLHREISRPVEREVFLADLLARIEYKYMLWHRQKTDLIKSINRSLQGYGKWVRMEINGKLRPQRYKMLGTDEKGKLLMLNQDGGIESFSYEQIRIVTD